MGLSLQPVRLVGGLDQEGGSGAKFVGAEARCAVAAIAAAAGHFSRYATLASPTLRAAYDEAMNKMRRQFTLTPVGKPILPDKAAGYTVKC